MTRARDLANLGSNPPLTSDLGTQFVQEGVVTSVQTAADTIVAWDPYNIIDYGESSGLNIYTFTEFPTDAYAYFSSLSVGDVLTLSVGGTNYSLTIQNIWDMSTTHIGISGTEWTPDWPSFDFVDTYIVVNNTAVTTTASSSALAALTQLDSGYVIGSTSVSGGTASGSNVAFNVVYDGISVGDSVGYWSTPTSLTAKTTSGGDRSLKFESSIDQWRFDGKHASVGAPIPVSFTPTSTSVAAATSSNAETPETIITRPNPTSQVAITITGEVNFPSTSGVKGRYQIYPLYSLDEGATWSGTNAPSYMRGPERTQHIQYVGSGSTTASWDLTHVLETTAPTIHLKVRVYFTTPSSSVKYIYVRTVQAEEYGV